MAVIVWRLCCIPYRNKNLKFGPRYSWAGTYKAVYKMARKTIWNKLHI